MENIDIRPKEIAAAIKENLKALQEINYDELSEEEKAELKKEFEELRDIALTIKKEIKEEDKK